MKKQLVIILLLIANFIFAQQQVKSFIKLGYLNSTLKAESMGYKLDGSGKSNCYITIGAEYGFAKKLAVQGEFGFAGLGGYMPLTDTGSETKVHFTTIILPVSLKFYPVEKFSLLAGLNFGFITDAFAEISGEKVKLEDVRTFNFGLHVGADFQVSRKIMFEAKYNFGISNLVKETPGVTGVSLKNNFFQIGVGVLF